MDALNNIKTPDLDTTRVEDMVKDYFTKADEVTVLSNSPYFGGRLPILTSN